MKIILLLMTFALSSCAELPLTFAVQGNYGVYSYSPDHGVTIAVDATK